MALNNSQRVNHFRNFYEIARKDLLIKNLKRMKKQPDLPAKWDFFPATFGMPTEYSLFLDEFKRSPPGTVWIMKPISKSQGKGIFLFTKLNQIAGWRTDMPRDASQTPPEAYVVQRYIASPYLIGGKKFDLRIYALVMSYTPLVVYLYRSGFARFSHHRFSLDDINNTYIHLTNVAVQKTSDSYTGHAKWDLVNVRQFVTAKHGAEAARKVFNDIQAVIVHCLLSVQRVMFQDRHCFELYGYDILIDSDLKPWVLEVNASPSMTAENPEDYKLKTTLLQDVLYIVDVENKRPHTAMPEEHVGGFDLVRHLVAVTHPVT
eukprot:TRINITY_DN4042_c0_g1_i2.p1 TRINITY_DN4042_c0_g1~~TRINITY_DN4042_c0_g1_i2.p1  ORF type:complete len:353 (+),score=104.14 TRINITY_DN4042_c0_g1_i2:106-1059(+)